MPMAVLIHNSMPVCCRFRPQCNLQHCYRHSYAHGDARPHSGHHSRPRGPSAGRHGHPGGHQTRDLIRGCARPLSLSFGVLVSSARFCCHFVGSWSIACPYPLGSWWVQLVSSASGILVSLACVVCVVGSWWVQLAPSVSVVVVSSAGLFCLCGRGKFSWPLLSLWSRKVHLVSSVSGVLVNSAGLFCLCGRGKFSLPLLSLRSGWVQFVSSLS